MYNEGALIVDIDELRAILPGAAGAIYPEKPNAGQYARVLLLTETAIKALVKSCYDEEFASYAKWARDFPICTDFSNVCCGDVMKKAAKLGIAVRPAFGRLDYTKTSMNGAGQHNRHAINWAALADRRVIYFEPQSGEWMSAPVEFLAYDDFRL